LKPLTVSFKRIRKILEKAGKQAEGVHVQTDLFEGDAERTLFSTMRKAAPKVEDQKTSGALQRGAGSNRGDAARGGQVL